MRGAGQGGPIRVATVGFQGFGNLGDEAILTGIEALLARPGVHVTTVFSGPQPDTIAAFPSARRIVEPRHLPGLRALRALRRVDLLVLAGGGLFNDHWTGVVPRYAAWVLAARLTGARVAWVGVGVGPIRRGWMRWLARLAARASHVVLVRDAESVTILGSAGRARLIPDPSVFNLPPAEVPRAGLALIVRAPVQEDAPLAARLLAGLSAAIADAGSDAVVLTMAGEADRQFSDALRRALEQRGVPGVEFDSLGPTPQLALARLSELSALITVRLHGLLLAALAGVPTVPIAYDAKVRVAAERLGIGELVVPLDAASGPLLLEKLEAARSDDCQVTVRERLNAMRAEADEVGNAIRAAGARR
ncbi:MAG: polysaccharide pyruvyl transferase family protein [Candidatus Limnocylindria bacterium]